MKCSFSTILLPENQDKLVITVAPYGPEDGRSPTSRKISR